jgi:drug/metabolite transporter (DMT)-like permease
MQDGTSRPKLDDVLWILSRIGSARYLNRFLVEAVIYAQRSPIRKAAIPMNQKTRPILEIALSCMIWSFSGVLSKSVPWNALSIVGFRSLIAVILLGIYRRSFRPVLTRGTWIGAGAVVTTGVLFIFANKLTSAANAIVLQYAMPIFIILHSVIFRHKRPSTLELVTVLTAAAGITLCFAQGFQGGGMLGNLLSLTSAVTYAVMFLAGQRNDCDALSFTYLGALLGCTLLVFMPFDSAIRANPIDWVYASLMGVCLGLGYLFFSAGMRNGISPLSAAIIANVEPILNPTWCFLFLGEQPGNLTLAGTIIVLAVVSGYTILSSKTAIRSS